LRLMSDEVVSIITRQVVEERSVAGELRENE
jgi:hypothetical protein